MKNNKFFYIVIVLLLIIILLLVFLLFRDTSMEVKDNQSVNNSDVENKEDLKQDNSDKNINESEVVVYTKEELFSKLSGIWKYVDNNGVNFVLRVFIDETGSERVSIGQYGTDNGIFGKLTEVKYIENNVYRLSIFSIGCYGPDCLIESEDATYYVDIDIFNFDNKEILVKMNNSANVYSYIAKTWDEAESSFSY